MLISVCCITYNHEKYISKCIESILNQRGSFKLELIIGEDGSKDKTREICANYALKYPDKVFLLPGEANLGMSQNFLRTLQSCKGELIAICEGDDFWTDSSKIQYQIEYLNSHPEAVACFHNAVNVDSEDNVINKSYFQSEKTKFNLADCFKSLGSSYPTCSLVFKSTVFSKPFPNWFLERACDEFLDLYIAYSGELHFIDKKLAAYRIHNSGVWQGSTSLAKRKEQQNRILLLSRDPEFNQKFPQEVKQQIFQIGRGIIYQKESLYFDRWTEFFKILKFYFPRHLNLLLRDIYNLIFGTQYEGKVFLFSKK